LGCQAARPARMPLLRLRTVGNDREVAPRHRSSPPTFLGSQSRAPSNESFGDASGWPRPGSFASMGAADEEHNRRLLRARDAIDLAYAVPLDVPALAAVACMSPAHFIRCFKVTFGETPHRYLQRRRIERAMERLRRSDRTVSEVCIGVGWTSFATFSRTFREIVGCSPSEYRDARPLAGDGHVPTCFVKSWTRPAESSSSGTACPGDAVVASIS